MDIERRAIGDRKAVIIVRLPASRSSDCSMPSLLIARHVCHSLIYRVVRRSSLNSNRRSIRSSLRSIRNLPRKRNSSKVRRDYGTPLSQQFFRGCLHARRAVRRLRASRVLRFLPSAQTSTILLLTDNNCLLLRIALLLLILPLRRPIVHWLLRLLVVATLWLPVAVRDECQSGLSIASRALSLDSRWISSTAQMVHIFTPGSS